MGLGVPANERAGVSARLTVLQEHQGRHASASDYEQKCPVHRQEEEIAIGKEKLPDEHGSHTKDRNDQQVLEFKAEQHNLRVEVARNRTHT